MTPVLCSYGLRLYFRLVCFLLVAATSCTALATFSVDYLR